MDATEVLATGAVAVASLGVGAWLNHVIGRRERAEQRIYEDEKERRSRLREYRLQQLDAIINESLGYVSFLVRRARGGPPEQLPLVAEQRGTQVGLLTTPAILEPLAWVITQAEEGVFPASRADEDALDSLVGLIRGVEWVQRERILGDVEPIVMSSAQIQAVTDRVEAARVAYREGRAERGWRLQP